MEMEKTLSDEMVEAIRDTLIAIRYFMKCSKCKIR